MAVEIMPCCPQCREYSEDHELQPHPQGHGLYCEYCGYQDDTANQPELSDGFVALRRDAAGDFVTDDVTQKIKNFLESPHGFDLKIITDYLLINPATRLLPFAAHRISREACRIHVHLLEVRKKRNDAVKHDASTAGFKWNDKYMAAAAVRIACSQHNHSVLSEKQANHASSSRVRLDEETVVTPSIGTISARLSQLYPPLDPKSDRHGEIEPIRLARVVSRCMALLGYTPDPSTEIMARIEPILLHLQDIQTAMSQTTEAGIDRALQLVLVYMPPKGQTTYRKAWGGIGAQEGKLKRFLKDLSFANIRSHVSNVFLISSVIGLWEGCLPGAVAAALVITALEAEAKFKLDPKDPVEQELSAFSDSHRYTISDHYYKLREIAELWIPTLPLIGVAIPSLPTRGRKHIADGAIGGFGYLGDKRRVASLRDKSAACWSTICDNAQELIHFRIRNPNLPNTPRWERSRSRSVSQLPSPSPTPSFGPQFPLSPALTVASLPQSEDIEQAILNADDSSENESVVDSDAESVASPRQRRLQLRRQHGKDCDNDAGPVRISIEYPVSHTPLRDPESRARSEVSDTARSTVSTASTRAHWTPLRALNEELGPRVILDRPPYDPIKDHGLLIGERALVIRPRPSLLRQRGLLVSEVVKQAMLNQLAQARANGEIPRQPSRKDIPNFLRQSIAQGVHPLRALLSAGVDPDDIPHYHLVYSPIAFRCAWEGLDALTHPFTDDELLGDEFEVNLRSREERRLYDAELHIDGVWDEWCEAEANREAKLQQEVERQRKVASKARKVGEKFKSRRLNVDIADDPDESVGLDFCWRETDLALDIPGLNMNLVAKVTKERKASSLANGKKRAQSPDNDTTPKKMRPSAPELYHDV